MSPFPKFSVSLQVCLAIPYVIQSTTFPPRPGTTPMRLPTTALRTTSHLLPSASLTPRSLPPPTPLFFAI